MHWFRIISIALLGSILLLAVSLSTTTAQAATDIHGRGVVCNNSSVSIAVTAKTPDWQVVWFSPGQCSNVLTQDVDGIWGRDCGSDGNSCSYQTWKISDGFFSVSDAYVMPIPPGLALQLSGLGTHPGWVDGQSLGWPAPPLDSLHYKLLAP